MSESYPGGQKELNVSELEVVGVLKRAKILNEGETLTSEENAEVTMNAMNLCAADEKLALETAIALAYLETAGIETITRMNIDRFSLLLEDITDHAWTKEETGEILQFLKDTVSTKQSFMTALETWETATRKSTDTVTQGVMNERGEVLAIGDDRVKLLRRALDVRGKGKESLM